MSKKSPKIAIVGRPNVGKSAFFNRIAGKRIAVVHEEEGVTRDRLYARCECFGKYFDLIDTGGMNFDGALAFEEEVRIQAALAADEADVILFVVDGVSGLTPQDEEVWKLLREQKKPILVAVNKIDSAERENLIHDFHQFGEPHPVSAAQGYKVAELLEKALDLCPQVLEEEVSDSIKVALIGRPNVGKSTLLNQLLSDERSIVSDIAGTTRDSIDAHLQIDGQNYTLIDTAGIKRKPKEASAVEKFAAMRTQTAIERADICVLLLDSNEGLSVQDKRIANQIEEAGKGCILLFNKWDQIKGYRMEHCKQLICQENTFLAHCPILFASALTGRNTDKLFSLVKTTSEHLKQRITTGQLNKFVERALQAYSPPMIQGKRLRIYYLTQVKTNPPHFILFVNHTKLMLDTYQKYLVNAFRKAFTFSGCPLKFNLRQRSQREDISAYVSNRM